MKWSIFHLLLCFFFVCFFLHKFKCFLYGQAMCAMHYIHVYHLHLQFNLFLIFLFYICSVFFMVVQYIYCEKCVTKCSGKFSCSFSGFFPASFVTFSQFSINCGMAILSFLRLLWEKYLWSIYIQTYKYVLQY